MSGSTGGPVAVVDLGSGAAKLLVIDELGLAGQAPALVARSLKTKLIDGDGSGTALSDQAIDAAADALDSFAGSLAEVRPVRLAAVGTAWARTVSDLHRLDRLVEDKLGVGLDVLSGHREAELAFRGAVAGRDLTGQIVVLDLGSGSTEFAVGEIGDKPRTLSLPIGGRGLTGQYLLSDPLRPEELSSALTVVELYLDDLKRELPEISSAIESGTVIGVGAVSQIAEVEIGLVNPEEESVDGYRMAKTALEEVFRALAIESVADRAFNPGLRPGDVEDIIGAMCVLVEFMRRFPAEEILVSRRGLMYGLAAELAMNH